MDNSKKEAIQAIKDANNVLVTVSNNPSVDQLAAAIGMTLVLNKLGKHGTAVFSGAPPSTIEFLKPEDTLEKNTDSLRDFIISLDKSKADKLRYKVEDQHVKIFITPYKTTISEQDLVFSHGDFNVDVVLALGVHEQNELDQAITAHGRILHDAKIISINVGNPGQLGGMNINEQASSLSEVMAHISVNLKEDVFDSQIATAFLTGIVAETDRFSNEKTQPETMSVSAKLMTAGANQQLVATQLEVPPEPVAPPEPEPLSVENNNDNNDSAVQQDAATIKRDDGSLEIKHDDEPQKPAVSPHEIHVDEHGNMRSLHDELPPVQPTNQNEEFHDKTEASATSENERKVRSMRVISPPTNSGALNSSSIKEDAEQTTDPLSQTEVRGPILSHSQPSFIDKSKNNDTPQEKPAEQSDSQTQPTAAAQPPAPAQTPQSSPAETSNKQTPSTDPPIQSLESLESLEKDVNSTHQQTTPQASASQSDTPQTPPNDSPPANSTEKAPDIDKLQSAVDQALVDSGDQKPLEPISALNANPVDLDLGHEEQSGPPALPPAPANDEFLDISKVDTQTGLPQDSSATTSPATEQPKSENPPSSSSQSSAGAPPPVPPPMMPPLPHDDNNGDDLTLPPVNQ